MTNLRQQISRKQLLRSARDVAVPATIGVMVGIAGFLAIDSSGAREPVQQEPNRISAGQRLAPMPATSYRNCDIAHDAGAAPLRRGQPGYATHLDADGDGIGYESYPR